MEEVEKEQVEQKKSALDRREMIKMGVGAGVAMTAMLNASKVLAQQAQSTMPPLVTGPLAEASHNQVQHYPDIRESQEVITSVATGYITSTGPGWVNNSGRASGNGPMDECTRRIVDYVAHYDESKLTDPLVETIGYLMADTLGALYGGFESEPARIGARLAETMPGPCTVFGYGIKSTYEMAAFCNGLMIRHTDFNAAPHNNEMFGGILAVAEAVRASGPQTMAAMTIAYEVITAIGNTGLGNYDPGGFDCPYHSVGVAMGAGKLMGLNQDQLANAVSLAMVPHMPLYVCHIGTQSMWKGTHSAEQVRNGVWGAMLARAGMTGPCMPFEARDGLIEHIGPFTRELRLPTSPDGRLAIETIHGNGGGYKRFATEGNPQSFWQYIAQPLHEWCKPEELASIDGDVTYFCWQEISDPPKWDPRNRETADHSMPNNIARGLLDGEVFLDSFTKEKYMDPVAREIMSKITLHANLSPDFPGTKLTVTKKSGEKRVFQAERVPPMSHDELIQKYNKLADFMQVEKGQRDQVLKQWMDLKNCKDITEPIKLITKFGQARPLTDMSPSRIS
jgi:2-methylcitrate dehydratase